MLAISCGRAGTKVLDFSSCLAEKGKSEADHGCLAGIGIEVVLRPTAANVLVVYQRGYSGMVVVWQQVLAEFAEFADWWRAQENER